VDAEFPRGTTMKIKTAGLERADTKSRYEAYTLGINGGWLTVEEVRALEDLALRPPALSQHEQQPALPAGGAQ
jgi:phage portal protein BeeE